ncbi:MAG TPA: sugar transferase [Ilumatobacteraceae bacterium]|nr:sugar transferase [Ilumatobacteraceae bacterium]
MNSVESSSRSGTRRFLKRVFDVVVAGTALLLTLPVLLVAAMAIKLDSPGLLMCRHIRVGKDGVHFEMLRLRCTVVDAEPTLSELEAVDERSEGLPAEGSDLRVTRVGRILRWSSIDELPQLWNVVRGNMSVIGPRPVLPSDDENLTPDMRNHVGVLPGITGLWEISDRSKAS